MQHIAPQSATETPETIVELRSISKSYGTTEVLRPTSLSVIDGEFITVLGPSGSGKTTVLRIVGGFLQPTSGAVLYEGQSLAAVPAHKRPFNTVFQDYALFPQMNVEQNVGFGLRLRGQSRSSWLAAAQEHLELVGLGGFGGRRVSQLSGGQQQRVALARALVCRPRIVLLDEPLAALDADLRRQMQMFLKDLQRRVRTTFLFVTHDQEEAMTLSDRIVVMNQGRIEQVGTPRELYDRPLTRFVAGFFGDNNIVLAQSTTDGDLGTPFGRVPLPANGCVDVAVVAIRPESIVIGPRERGLAVDCVVVDVSFVGPITKLTLRPDAAPGLPLTVKVISERLSVIPERGAGLVITLPHERLTAIPERRAN